MKGVDFAETFSVQRVVRVFNINNKSFKVLAAATVCSFHLDLEPVITCLVRQWVPTIKKKEICNFSKGVCNVFFYVFLVH